ncbi:MAG: hypothetical protein EA362_01980 [Saprospirales bacterium]|nr:MAG: hypothetical protein EA362_01980 [Saprospirales bacterium]
MKRNDILWKGIIEDLFDDFLRFLYEDAEEIFDFDKGFEFLDKELEDLFPEKDVENVRFVDKLVKVYHRDKGEQWLLFHIEVQGYRDSKFSERMFTYYYRIRDRYQKKITAWAIFSDPYKNFHPDEYEETFLGTKIFYKFNTYKVMDQDSALLEASSNPFATVIQTSLLSLQKTPDSDLLNLKLNLVRNLIKKGFNKEKVRALMNFLRLYVRLNSEKSAIFESELRTIIGKTYPMGIEELVLDLERKAGQKIGEKIGEKRGEKRGKEKRTIEMVLDSYDIGLELDVISKISRLSASEVKKILKENDRL